MCARRGLSASSVSCDCRKLLIGLRTSRLMKTHRTNDSVTFSSCFISIVFLFNWRFALLFVLLGRPERYCSQRSYVLFQMFFFVFFSTRDLRAPSADRRETLPGDQKVLPYMYNLGFAFFCRLFRLCVVLDIWRRRRKQTAIDEADFWFLTISLVASLLVSFVTSWQPVSTAVV